ncbi:hypothetical protein AB0D04_26285 [Streptomyces sp. NPDC048483]|uniref:hypothetical protein n=1 Tax=Streptomyces sp. NPDC048483 TaxID=3154927 RepID=UPI003436CAD2
MEWKSEEFGASHEGRAGAVLPDGSEPKPMYFDAGSGGGGQTTSDWWVYDGTLGAPQAAGLRASCSCGWRGSSRYPIDWSEVPENRPYEYDTSGTYDDWEQHIAVVEAQAVPLPDELADLLQRVDDQLSALVDQAPVAALRAVAALERTTGRISRAAAYHAQADEVPWDSIGKSLGLTEKDARSRLTSYAFRR